MKIQQKLAHRTNYGNMRSTTDIKYIVIHYTANDGDRAWNNANYFALNRNLGASAHYFVDDDNIYQSVPDNYIAWSVGSKTVDKSQGGGKYYNKCTNANSLNIELCDTEKNNKYNVTEKTKENAIKLVKQLMSTYNIKKDNVIRHFDATGKHCPAYWINDKLWEKEFHSKLDSKVGWIKDDRGWYWQYADGSYCVGWNQIDFKWYYFKEDGYLATNEYIKASDYKTTKKLYWVDDNGAWDNKSYRWISNEVGWWLAEIDGKWYAQNEWAKIDGYWYYFDDEGYMIHNRIMTIDGQVCQFNSNGQLIK